MKKQVIGILAHVDAGKTTLSEALLYTTGKIKKLGRVDWRNTYLDTHELERERGITIFSKQAVIESDRLHITLLDTPGHVDFSAETERTLSVLDCAILVISGSEGVQAHTETLWHLLERYHVPTFVFVTKMDLSAAGAADIMRGLNADLGAGCVDFTDPDRDARAEHIAMADEDVLEAYLDSGTVTDDDITRLIAERKLFPCFFGSGLRLDGVDALLAALEQYTLEKQYPAEPFGAKVYKIAHDKSGVRLTYLMITGGSLNVRQPLTYLPLGAAEPVEEKITGIRLYSGAKFENLDRADAGDVCAVAGLSGTYAGQGLGTEESAGHPYLEPVLSYRIALPMDVDARTVLPKLQQLEEEEPLLHIVWNERYGEIHAQIMGQVQTEVLISLISERYGVDVRFDDGRIMYRETITEAVEGVGHFEPLRHYAEVHLLLEPLEPGSGLVFDTVCSENFLERNWQRLILTHLEEKQHLGVMTGSAITDMKITLTSGRAHLKHTVGGDFRESTYRAVRQGLMTALAKKKTVLLEPYYAFRLEIPGECVGRAISDILARDGTFDEHEAEPGTSVLSGRAPVATIGGYARDVASYTHGRGKFSCRVEGYFPCHNTDEVLAQFAYDPTADVDNTPDSVFCSHGAGFVVPWDRVPEYMHLEGLDLRSEEELQVIEPQVIRQNLDIDEKELEAIMEREFGPIKRRVYSDPKNPKMVNVSPQKFKKSLYIVDGYNVIFAWDELSELAQTDLEGARQNLCDILANYQAYTGRDIVLVFDAYNVKGSVERKFDYHGLHVVYTKEGELGDVYISKMVKEIGRDFTVKIVTSDGLIQLQAIGSGVLRLSAREFREEVLAVDEEIREYLKKLREENEKKTAKK
ncbi:MAG: TetM/TetW/TetO/TetS family tetracycline resistance ribosomal protection protein [Clostridia bacterium]|nr:TetM/TetW/TetO/TetS family tetracycline resistance ribosomal protection protein [Clostridia bacterium]